MDNIIANMTLDRHITIDNWSVAGASVLENNLFYQPGGPVSIKWGGLVTGDMDDFRAQTSTGGGCIVGDPQFVDSANEDYHVALGALGYLLSCPLLRPVYTIKRPGYRHLVYLFLPCLRLSCFGAA